MLKGYFILADGGYPCLSEPMALITPYKQPVRGMAEQRFNYHHSRGRTIIERAFGMMKTRFRCIFLEALEVQTQFVPKVVTTCAVLHNICLGVGDEVAFDGEVDLAQGNDGDGGGDGVDTQSGAAWRVGLTNALNPHDVPVDHAYIVQHPPADPGQVPAARQLLSTPQQPPAPPRQLLGAPQQPPTPPR